MLVLSIVFIALQALITLCLAYLYVLALASVREPSFDLPRLPAHRFAIAIPAHNEQATIGRTIQRLKDQAYPADLYDIFVVADNCTDSTADAVREAGGIALEREDAEHRGKGYAMAWLFERILERRPAYDALVVFDADTVVDTCFLGVMDAMLARGHKVIQGKHVIANPERGWFAAVMYMAFVMDNRLRNLGRSNLGLSSKLMGDAMCFRRSVLLEHPWTAALQTEDAEYRSMLVLNGIRVVFAPQAIARGEMVTDLNAAQHQRSRWMRGRAEVTRRLAPQLIRSGLARLNLNQLDSAVELLLPSFSTLLMLAVLATGLGAGLAWLGHGAWGWLAATWAAFAAYPLLGLFLERAPAKLYLYLAAAPVYVLWRTWLRLMVRVRRGSAGWVRTPRSTETRTGG